MTIENNLVILTLPIEIERTSLPLLILVKVLLIFLILVYLIVFLRSVSTIICLPEINLTSRYFQKYLYEKLSNGL